MWCFPLSFKKEYKKSCSPWSETLFHLFANFSKNCICFISFSLSQNCVTSKSELRGAFNSSLSLYSSPPLLLPVEFFIISVSNPKNWGRMKTVLHKFLTFFWRIVQEESIWFIPHRVYVPYLWQAFHEYNALVCSFWNGTIAIVNGRAWIIIVFATFSMQILHIYTFTFILSPNKQQLPQDFLWKEHSRQTLYGLLPSKSIVFPQERL